MDLYDAKDRIAVALVESIFRRARYRVRPFQNEPGLRFIRDDSLPVWYGRSVVNWSRVVGRIIRPEMTAV